MDEKGEITEERFGVEDCSEGEVLGGGDKSLGR